MELRILDTQIGTKCSSQWESDPICTMLSCPVQAQDFMLPV